MKKIIFLTVLTFCFFNFFSDKNINSLGVSSLSNLSKKYFDSQNKYPAIDLYAPGVEHVSVAINLSGSDKRFVFYGCFSYKLLKMKIFKKGSSGVFEKFILSNIERSFGVFDDNEYAANIGVLALLGINRPFNRDDATYKDLHDLVYRACSHAMRKISLTYVFVRGANFDFYSIDKRNRTVYINVDYFNSKKTLNRQKEEARLFEESFATIVMSLNDDFKEEERAKKAEEALEEERLKRKEEAEALKRAEEQEIKEDLETKSAKKRKDEIIPTLPDNCGPFVVWRGKEWRMSYPFDERKCIKATMNRGGVELEKRFSKEWRRGSEQEIRRAIGEIFIDFSAEPSFKEILRKAKKKEITIYLTSGFHEGNARSPAGAPAFVDFSGGKCKLKISEYILRYEPFLKWILYWELLRIVSPKQKGDYAKFLQVANAHDDIEGVVSNLERLEREQKLVWGDPSIFNSYRFDTIKEQDFKNWINWRELYRSA
ncbi:hypothetical protein AB834_06345 [PVC group bacterium (ex Bugula neritina AB1)]|nr:hypothetical protein AB834_06345 [PVC group bacterium (ex Bugula neritina AB1)]